MKLLKSKIKFINNLGEWGNFLGNESLKSRGIFYIFERFHLNHKFSIPNSISKIENQLLKINCKCILLVISPEFIGDRLKTRDNTLSGKRLDIKIKKYINDQNKYIELSKRSLMPTLIIKTDKMNWDEYAENILSFLDYQ